MDQSMSCPFCNLKREAQPCYIFCDDVLNKIVGFSIGANHFQPCSSCRHKLEYEFAVHNTNRGIKIKLYSTIYDKLRPQLLYLIKRDTGGRDDFCFSQLRSAFNEIKEHSGKSVDHISEQLSEMLLEGLRNSATFLKPFNLEFYEVSRCSEIEHVLSELELLGVDRNTSKSNATAHIRKTVIEGFRKEYHLVRDGVRSKEIISHFSDLISTWRCGVNTVRRISNGYYACDLGCVIAMLCVCSAISRTLDKHYPRDKLYDSGGSYFEHFGNDLYRWIFLFGPESILYSYDSSCFGEVVGTIWNVNCINGIKKDDTIIDFDDDPAALSEVLAYNNLMRPTNASDTGAGEDRPLYGTSTAILIVFVFYTWLDLYTEQHNSQSALLHQAGSVLIGAERILDQAECRDYGRSGCKRGSHKDKGHDGRVQCSLVRVKCANKVLKAFIKTHNKKVEHSDSANPGYSRLDIVNTNELVRSHSPVLGPNSTTAPGEAPEITGSSSQVSNSNRISTPSVDRGYRCTEDGCQKSYANQQNLNKHKRNRHQDKVECCMCGKEYTTEGVKTHKCAGEDRRPLGPQSKRRKTSSAESGM